MNNFSMIKRSSTVFIELQFLSFHCAANVFFFCFHFGSASINLIAFNQNSIYYFSFQRRFFVVVVKHRIPSNLQFDIANIIFFLSFPTMPNRMEVTVQFLRFENNISKIHEWKQIHRHVLFLLLIRIYI